MLQVDHAASRCPHCSKELNATTNANADRAPQVGSFAVCFGCQMILVFGEGLVLRLASEADLAALPRVHRRRLKKFQESLRLAKEAMDVLRVTT